MIDPQKEQVGASPRSMIPARASAAWWLPAAVAGEGARPTLPLPLTSVEPFMSPAASAVGGVLDLRRRFSKSICCWPVEKRRSSQRKM